MYWIIKDLGKIIRADPYKELAWEIYGAGVTEQQLAFILDKYNLSSSPHALRLQNSFRDVLLEERIKNEKRLKGD